CRVSKVVSSQSLSYVRFAGCSPIERWWLRRNTYVQECMLIHPMAAGGIDSGGRLVEIERVHARGRRGGAGSAGNVERAVEPSRMEERFGVLAHRSASLLLTAICKRSLMLRPLAPW